MSLGFHSRAPTPCHGSAAPPPRPPPQTAVVFSSAASVQLWVNGADLGRKEVPLYGVVNYGGVVFQPGNITATSFNQAGDVLSTTTVVTTGPAVALKLTVEEGSTVIAADGECTTHDASGAGRHLSRRPCPRLLPPSLPSGEDVALVRVTVVDAQGRMVPDANPTITFAVTSGGGSVYGVGNGDPSDHTPAKGTGA